VTRGNFHAKRKSRKRAPTSWRASAPSAPVGFRKRFRETSRAGGALSHGGRGAGLPRRARALTISSRWIASC
jgi:hypothetical protein